MSQAVLQWASEAKAAGQRHGIPPHILLGLVDVESGGREGLTSSAGAGGLTQFMPATAKEYGVNVRPGHARSQLDGAARYLKALGFDRNPERALASYNAGPSYWQVGRGYARKVLQRSQRYKGVDGPTLQQTGQGKRPASTQDASDSPIGETERGGAVKALLWVVLIGAGVTLVGLGSARAAGVRNPLAGAA